MWLKYILPAGKCKVVILVGNYINVQANKHSSLSLVGLYIFYHSYSPQKLVGIFCISNAVLHITVFSVSASQCQAIKFLIKWEPH